MHWKNRRGLTTSREVLQDVESHPGSTIVDIRLRLDLDGKTVRRHLHELQKDGAISVERFERRIIVYRRSPAIPTRRHLVSHVVLENARLQELMQAIIAEGTTTHRIAERVRRDPRRVHQDLVFLAGCGLLEHVSRGLWRRLPTEQGGTSDVSSRTRDPRSTPDSGF